MFLKGVFEQQRSVGGGEGDLDDTGEGVLGLHRPACSAGEGDGEGVGSGVLWQYRLAHGRGGGVREGVLFIGDGFGLLHRWNFLSTMLSGARPSLNSFERGD